MDSYLCNFVLHDCLALVLVLLYYTLLIFVQINGASDDDDDDDDAHDDGDGPVSQKLKVCTRREYRVRR